MKLAIINYPTAMQSAVFGLLDLFEMANLLPEAADNIQCHKLSINQLNDSEHYDIIILPPALTPEFYLEPDKNLLHWLIQQYQQNSMLCSVCSGAFILGKAGLLTHRQATTHWALAEDFSQAFKQTELISDHILVNNGQIITAGGIMSWIDLGLDIVKQYAGAQAMRQLGKNLVVDTGYRAQSYYQQFQPKRDHGHQAILTVQDHLDCHFANKIKIAALADLTFMSPRSFLRHFQHSTGFNPSEYIQRIRIQKACELLEQTQKSFDTIALEVGYSDSSACRKVFVHIMGLTPKQFRQRFVKAYKVK
ncbi:GlxA family transcriptional regulator [uncultured Shewanella sp.]|uniref:GlxA family transcriptional regulator n=1 Tax=uncultured Shewanella sp. TaxID=173975 RepID=UPI0026289B9F|nr:helix-turn-helix domain-containing protein [uncultured Shewanella sp.]